MRTLWPSALDFGCEGCCLCFYAVRQDWISQQKLLAGDGKPGDHLGNSVAIDGDTIVAGASDYSDGVERRGAAYVFSRANGGWVEQAKFLGSDPQGLDFFGSSVSIEGDTLVIGSPDDSESQPGFNAGSAYVFVRSGNEWGQQAKLTASDAANNDFFASRVSISGNSVAVSASGVDMPGAVDQGAVYIFDRTDATWAQNAKIFADDGSGGEFFGLSSLLVGYIVCRRSRR
jgi:hypothetical protein